MAISYRIDGEFFLTPSGISGPDQPEFGVTLVSAGIRSSESVGRFFKAWEKQKQMTFVK